MENDKVKGNQSSELEMKSMYDSFYSRVFQDAFFISRDIHLAQDITQETFVKAFRQMDTLRDKEKMGAWLSTIAVRTAIDFVRKESKNKTTMYDEVVPSRRGKSEISSIVEDSVEANLITEEITQKIMELKKEHREVLILRYVYDLAQNEIAAWTDVNIGTVKSRLHRAKRALKFKLLKDRIIGNEAFRKWLFLLILLEKRG